MTLHFARRSRRSTALKGLSLALSASAATMLFGSTVLTSAVAQQPQQAAGNARMITPNFKDTDLGQIVEAVAAVTQKTFIIDPRVRAQVTVLSNTPMSPDAFYELFLAILQVNNFAALPVGNTVKIIPAADARNLP